jgi:hypothetical protein
VEERRVPGVSSLSAANKVLLGFFDHGLSRSASVSSHKLSSPGPNLPMRSDNPNRGAVPKPNKVRVGANPSGGAEFSPLSSPTHPSKGDRATPNPTTSEYPPNPTHGCEFAPSESICHPEAPASHLQTTFVSESVEWSWSVPDISHGSAWHHARVMNLLHACKGLPDQLCLFDEGLSALATHQENYGIKGAQHLQLLLWEFPPEHWHDLRHGCPMNFLEPPVSGVVLNSAMTDEQCGTAIEFVEELCQLGVLQEAEPDEVLTNCPLFILPKAGQPGEWRVLADMKKGGQNKAVGRDLVFLNRPSMVLPQLYSGGWSAVGDASKCFYQFPTAEVDRPYLGVIHPGTGMLYCYCGLPMGGANSPAVAGRIGGSLIRLCRENYPTLFDGVGRTNTWYDKFQTGVFNPKLGHGFILEGEDDGLPAVLIFVHMDDYFLHGPTCEKTN